MTSMDKAGMAIAVAVVAIAVAFASGGAALQAGDQSGTSIFSPQVTQQQKQMAQEKAQQTQKTMDEIMEEQRQAKMDQPSSVTVTPPKVEDVPAMTSGPKTVTVSMPTGTSVPGCEETNTCFIPSSVKINVGDTISWSNDDTAAHTVTSGKPANGPDGNFDSSLLMVGKAFDVTFDNSGSYDYFCMVHPWMVGKVVVK